MRNFRESIQSFAVIAALSIVFSCQKEESFKTSSNNIGVKVNEEASVDVNTKSDPGDDGTPYVFVVNGEELSLTQSISRMGIQMDTKGNPITDSGDEGFTQFTLNFRNADDSEDSDRPAVGVNYESGAWTLEDKRYWPKDETAKLKFYASNSSSAGDSQTVLEEFLSTGGVKISYEDSGDESSAAENETDLVYAYTEVAQENGIPRDDDTAIGLTFHHALAGIEFNFGAITNGLKLTNVTLSGITTSGECLYKDDTFGAWTLGDGKANLSQSFNATTSSSSTVCDNDGYRTFFIIPQSVPEDATMTFTFEYGLSTFASDSIKQEDYGKASKVTFEKRVKFSEIGGVDEWKAGDLYTYTISGNIVFAELGKTLSAVASALKVSSSSNTVNVVKKVTFSVGENPVTTSDCEVQSSRSLTKIYATFDSTTGEVVLHTSAPKIFAPKDSGKLFSGLSSMTSVDFAGLDTRNVVNMKEMFNGCSSLESVHLSNFDTNNVTSMASMFTGCSTLTTLNLSSFDTRKVTTMYQMFRGCSALNSITFDFSEKKFNTGKVENMSQVFYACSSLAALKLDFDTSNVTDMSSMFYGCSKLASLDITTFNTAKVKTMAMMFAYCSILTELKMAISEDKFNTGSVTTMISMFQGCNSLPTLNLSGFDTSNVTTMQNMFNHCHLLTELNISTFETSKVTDMSSMFSQCWVLETLTFEPSKFNTSSATTMNSMFLNCNKLKSLNLSSFNTAKVTTMASMFNACNSLANLTLTSFDTSNVTDMSSMFFACTAMDTIDLSSFNTAKVTKMPSMLSKCSILANLTLGQNFTVASSKTNICYLMSSSVTAANIAIKCTQAAKDALTSTGTGINSNYASWTWTDVATEDPLN